MKEPLTIPQLRKSLSKKTHCMHNFFLDLEKKGISELFLKQVTTGKEYFTEIN